MVGIETTGAPLGRGQGLEARLGAFFEVFVCKQGFERRCAVINGLPGERGLQRAGHVQATRHHNALPLRVVWQQFKEQQRIF